jgi:hydroxypyruvate reductase
VEADLVRDARRIFEAAVRAVQAPALLADLDLERLAGRPLGSFRQLVVVGTGKASMAVAGALEVRLEQGADRVEGEVVVPTGYPEAFPDGLPRPARVAVAEGGHPVPTEGSVRAAQRALARAEAAGPDDLVVALVSGGGSALWALPAHGLTLDDVQATTRLLLASGVEIGGVNAVRKHVSQVAGGRLAVAAAPSRLVALVLSDVVGDDLATVASGPTVPDPTTFADALAVLAGAGLTGRAPRAVRLHLERGAAGRLPETPGADDPAFETARTHLLAGNDTALDAARREAERLGYAVRAVEREVEGEARTVGDRAARRAGAASPGGPACWLWGGETTVTVVGTGRGGRNQEVALAAALALDGADADLVVLSGGTDGVDGPTDAAGGWASPRTAGRIRAAGLDPAACLADNDAYRALDAAGALVRTGPTHTNVADVALALRGA